MKNRFFFVLAIASGSALYGCKVRTDASSAQSVLVRKDSNTLQGYDVVIVRENMTSSEVGDVYTGSNNDRGMLTLKDVNGEVVAEAPVIMGKFVLGSVGVGKSIDSTVGIDRFDGKKFSDLLGTYYSGIIGINLMIGGGGDIGVNSAGVILRNGSFKYGGIMAQLGFQVFTISAKDPTDPIWKKEIFSTTKPDFKSESYNRRAWVLDRTLPKGDYHTFVSLSWDPSDQKFYSEVLITDSSLKTILPKTRLTYDREKEKFRDASGTVQLWFQEHASGALSTESCFVRWSRKDDTSYADSCTGWTAFVKQILGPNGKLK